MGYRDDAIEEYGHQCEICGHGIVDVHHIDYNEHQDYEDALRKSVRDKEDVDELLEKCKESGYLDWNGHQLSKDDRTTNLAVLCPNCHRLIHKLDAGMKLLRVLPPRR